jgi:hypothetical protein
MKQTLLLVSSFTLALLLVSGCSDQSGTATKIDTSKEDTAAIEKVFNELKSDPDSLSAYAPEERPLIAYFEVMMARFVMAIQQDESKKTEAEQAFIELIKKHNLTDTLEFTDNEDRMKAAATVAFADVNLAVFRTDVRAYMKTYGSTSSDEDSGFEDEEEPTPVSMQGLQLNGDEAKATIINTDETEQPFVFVKSDGQWFVSWDRTYGEPEDGSGWTTEKSFVVTFENEASLENATAKKLLKGVDYDRSSRPTLEKTGKPLQLKLTFMVPIGGETGKAGFEAAIKREENRMDAIKQTGGVTKVQHHFEEEFEASRAEARKLVSTGNDGARTTSGAEGFRRKNTATANSTTSTKDYVLENQQDRAKAGYRTPQYDLGMRYLTGNGVERDNERAKHWLQLAAAQGHTRAKKELAQLEQPQSPRADAQPKQFASRAAEAADALTLASRQLWANQESAYLETRRRTLAWAAGTAQISTAERVAKLASLYPSSEASEQKAALALAQTAVTRVPRVDPFIQMAYGMAAFRAEQYDDANRSLIAAEEALQRPEDPRRSFIEGTGGYYRAMSLFHQGKESDARQLYRATLAKMKPLPVDGQAPLADGATHDDLILWLAYKEAKALLNE